MFKIDHNAENLKQKIDPSFTRALCIHGHFYQPPRENPFSGVIPEEIGAAPYPNWNARIHAECYRPNAELGNFERISFNLGPTLFEWIEKFDTVTHQRIIAQDRSNVKRFGVGNAIAQAYNHTILPWASRADKVTQIYWGIADFEHRFGRPPHGMWLPETAVDYETLEILVDHGIQFTILAPWQAVDEEIDPTEPYWVPLPSGRKIVVFFYQNELSGGISFNQGMTSNAHEFALNDLVRFFNQDKFQQGRDQLLVVASDGELYGHHQAFRDWFLAYLVNGAGARAGIRLTYPALWLLDHPPTLAVEIRENTSWSCHHGIQRWAGHCGCTSGDGHWKAFLRRALDNFAIELDKVYIGFLEPFGVDPWLLRDEYIHCILGNLPLEELVLKTQSAQAGIEPEIFVGGDWVKLEMLLEAQHQRQRMYTSCGWFFDEFSRIEPQNNIAYAAQAAYLVYQATGMDLTAGILRDLNLIKSQHYGLSGDQVFDGFWRTGFQHAEPNQP